MQSLTGQESFSVVGGDIGGDVTTTTNSDLVALKQEILTEVRKEINKAKQEILEGRFVMKQERLKNLIIVKQIIIILND